jgi:type II secretory pathway pseudopilin PulG
MSISPFSVRPMHPGEHESPREERRRARLVVAIAILGIAATLLAYAISPGVRHAVGHAAHSVRHAVSNVFDHDKANSSDDAHRTGPSAGSHATSTRRAKRAPGAKGAASAP